MDAARSTLAAKCDAWTTRALAVSSYSWVNFIFCEFCYAAAMIGEKRLTSRGRRLSLRRT